MKCRVITLYGIYQIFDPDCGIQFLPDLSDDRLLWGLSGFDLPAGKFLATFEFSVAPCGRKYFCFVLYGIADYSCDYANGFHRLPSLFYTLIFNGHPDNIYSHKFTLQKFCETI